MTQETKNYLVTVSVECSCQFEIKATSEHEAAKAAKQMAEDNINVDFADICIEGDSHVMPINSDAIEELED